MNMFWLRTGLVVLSLSLLSGCAGYRVGNVSGRDLQGVRSVFVPMIKNSSLEPHLEAVVTDALIQRFNNDGTLETNQTGDADSELDVTVVSVDKYPVSTTSNDTLVTSEYELTMKANATFVNRRLGRKIFENITVQGSTNFYVQADLNESIRQAIPLAAQDMAKNVVQQVTEGW